MLSPVHLTPSCVMFFHSFVLASLNAKLMQHLFLIRTLIISVALYEIAQPLLGKPIDPWDIVETVMTGGLCLILYKFIHPISMDKRTLNDK